ncbi:MULTISPECIES: hypothetical protein [unclassified Moorena]|uniref:hypothetical protein n=1 Tax=unclassified Moorena TaxID=2683338 RepID=UPI0013C73EB9|nr:MULTISPECIES: hypothetical protein [unclassified Moorena]NEO22030.1 hypothetical protein [Moorena sp. SIO4A5]NEQ59548.1 hypothetical protein [Moorena sp. SIO4A1]
MILARRKTHFYSFVVLGVVLPVCFLAGILLRPSYEPVDVATNKLFTQAGFVTQTQPRKEIGSTKLEDGTFRFHVETFVNYQGKLVMELKSDSLLQVPDPLLYWEATKEAPTEISDRSILLGNLAGLSRKQFLLPGSVRGKAGHLLIYSQGQQKLIAALPLRAKLTTVYRY